MLSATSSAQHGKIFRAKISLSVEDNYIYQSELKHFVPCAGSVRLFVKWQCSLVADLAPLPTECDYIIQRRKNTQNH